VAWALNDSREDRIKRRKKRIRRRLKGRRNPNVLVLRQAIATAIINPPIMVYQAG
jgi:hypothetical protein